MSAYWPVRFARWPSTGDVQPGFTVIVAVPGDLPVFTELALAVVAQQRSPGRVETMVIPDRTSSAVAEIVARHRAGWAGGELVLRNLVRPERWLLPKLNDPGRNHAVQLISALRASRTEHVVLHDADLFTLSDVVHEDSYEAAVAAGADVVGVSAAWDPWYAEHGLRLVATWEMMARTRWIRSFPPHRLMAHDATMFGEKHTFDTTFWVQCHTPPGRLSVRQVDHDLVHFNYVISTYRWFRRAVGPFEDRRFRLLLIRLLIDVFEGYRPRPGSAAYALPERGELVDGLVNPSARVSYARSNSADYATFRRKLDAVLDGPWSDAARVSAVRPTLDAFDEHFLAPTAAGEDG